MAHPEKDVVLAGAAGNSSASRFSEERRSAAGKDFEPEQGGQQTTAGQTGTGYPGPEIELGEDFEPEQGGVQTEAGQTGTGYPGPEIGKGKDFEPEQGGQQSSAGQTGTGYPGPEVEEKEGY